MLEDAFNYLRANAGLFATRLVAALVVFALIMLLTRLVGRLVQRGLRSRGARGTTLSSIVRSVVTLTGITLAGVMALSQLGINVAAVLAGAGVIGLAVGFGAQTLVKDCISGFFLILDDVVQVGDVAQVDDKTGVVERVGLRVTQVRAYSGQLWYIPNGTIEKVGNFNREWNRAEVKVGLAYEADVTHALEVLREVGAAWAAENPELAVGAPFAQGVLELGDSAVTLRLVAKIPAGKLWEVEFDLRRRVKKALEDADLEISYPKSVLIVRGGSAEVAAAGAEPPAATAPG